MQSLEYKSLLSDDKTMRYLLVLLDDFFSSCEKPSETHSLKGQEKHWKSYFGNSPKSAKSFQFLGMSQKFETLAENAGQGQDIKNILQ